MTAIFDIDKSENWQQVYSSSYQATRIPGKQIDIYQPIPVTEIPLGLDSGLLAVSCTSETYPTGRRYLGHLEQVIINPGNLPNNVSTGDRVSLFANATVLGKFTRFDDIYGLLIKPKFHVEQLSIIIHQYVGSEYFEVEQRLNIIENKIDQLL